MNTDAYRIKNRIQAGAAVATAVVLVACGGTASPPVSNAKNANEVFFKTLTLHSGGSSQFVGTQSALRRRSADACVPADNLTLAGVNDVNNSVVGTLNGGNSLNVSWTDDSTGYANYITSPIAGGYNIADVQANLTAQGYINGYSGGLVSGAVNIMQGIVVTTNGNTTVTAGQTVSGAAMNLSIVNNGTATASVPLNTPITLAHGEVVEWTGTTLTETVTDPSSGGSIAMTVTYFPTYDQIAGNPPNINLTVVATNVDMGGALVSTALSDDAGAPGTPCPSSIPGSTASACPLPTATPTPGATETPLVHPTSSVSSSPCSS